MQPFITGFIYLSPVLVLLGLLLTIIKGSISRPAAAALLVLGLAYMGCFEFIREGGRRPYILRNYMYSNSILTTDMDKVRENGLLK